VVLGVLWRAARRDTTWAIRRTMAFWEHWAGRFWGTIWRTGSRTGEITITMGGVTVIRIGMVMVTVTVAVIMGIMGIMGIGMGGTGTTTPMVMGMAAMVAAGSSVYTP
jgi:hypothetical protein